MSQNNQNQQGLSVDFGDELSKNLTIHKNVKQEIIITTADKIKLVLISTREILTAQRDWWTPFGLLISFITTLCTADFKDAFGLTKEFWHAIFVLLTLGSGIWLLKAFYKLYKNWGQDNLDNIIVKIKLRSENALLEDESTNT
jgi:predicted acyltransferase